jgi:hypothetical protein
MGDIADKADQSTDGGTDNQDQHDKKAEEKKELSPEQKSLAELTQKFEDFHKKYQSDTDRLRTEKKQAEDKVEELEKEKMTAKERSEFEAKKREDDIAKREDQIRSQQLELDKRDVLEELLMPIKLKGNITGATKDDLKKSASDLKSYIDELVTAEVDRRFKDVQPPAPKTKPGEKLPEKKAESDDWRDELANALS